MRIDHIAIETSNFDNTIAWYKEFFGASLTWTLDGNFSAMTLSRLPGIKRLCELVAGDMRWHVIERAGAGMIRLRHSQFQHICLAYDKPWLISDLRKRWLELYESGKYKFSVPDQPTEINDHGGELNFYAFDVNGLEYEFSYNG